MKTNAAGLIGFNVFAYWIFIPEHDTTQKIQTVFHLKSKLVKYRNYYSCHVDKKTQQPIRRVQMEGQYGTYNQYW